MSDQAWGTLPTGRVLETPDRPKDYMGTIGVLRPATDKAVQAARKHFIEADLEDFERNGTRWIDKGTGEPYRVVRAAVLESLDPKRHASVFVVADNLLWFLKREGEESVVDSVEIGEVGGRQVSGREPISTLPNWGGDIH